MDFAWQLIGGLLLIGGIFGCVVPVVPGPLLSFCAVLCLVPTAHPPGIVTLTALGMFALAASVLDSVVPSLGAKKFHCSRLGVIGCMAGTIAGVFFLPLGILLGPFLGAVAGELLAGKSAGRSIWGGFGAFLGFLAGVFIKLAACAAMAVCFVRSL